MADKVHVIDTLVAKPGEAHALLDDYMARYAPGARARGMALAQILVSPPMWLEDQSNTIVIRWTLPDAAAWWQMRLQAGGDPAVTAWWDEVADRLVTRSRIFAAQPEDVEGLCDV